MRLLPYKTSFGRFFSRTGPTPIPNSISVIIDEHTIECNGPILAQHSTVLYEKLTISKEVYLDEFSGMVEGVKDCIELLYGEEVEVSMGNLQALMKFSVLFKVGEIYDLCVKWVGENAAVDGFEEFYKVSQFVHSLDNTRWECLEVCSKVVQSNSDSPTMVKDLITKFSLSEDDTTDLMTFFLTESLLEFTLQAVCDWLDSPKKALIVLQTIKCRKLYDGLSSQTLKPVGINFLKTLGQVTDDYQTLAAVNALQIKLMESTQHNSVDRPMKLYWFLRNRQWKDLSGQDLVAKAASLATSHAIYLEICLFSMKPLKRENIDAVWPSINPMLVGKSFSKMISRCVGQACPRNPPPPIQLKNISLKGYCTLLSKSQCEKLVESSQITLTTMDCQVDGCTQNTPHAFTVRLSESHPCYDLNVAQTSIGGRRAEQDHVHPGCISHWYIYYKYTYDYTSYTFPLTLNSYKETLSQLNLFKNSLEDHIVYIGCILSTDGVGGV